jgi:uncharacterized sulfatase
MSPMLGCYGDPQATTPNIDRLASEGVRYDNAFSVSGVCAPSRSCLITGMYPDSLGTMHMRCRNSPPHHVKCFPEYLQENGYYCTNNHKEDYNFETPPTAWNDSGKDAHFRNPPDKDQPFFAVFNFTVTHESRIGVGRDELPEDERKIVQMDSPHDAATIRLPPFYPDSPVIRKQWAHTYDLVTAMDRQVGEILTQLEEDGLRENTLVFYYSDHGTGAPRCKRWLWDSGIHVPLIVRWPGQIEPGTSTDRLVSFVDFAPTVLSLAGVEIPSHMQGKAFLGEAETEPREAVYAARDRMDERYDIIRAVRDKRYKYIRNYEPDVPYDIPLAYPESYAIMKELRRAQREGKLEGPTALFFRQTKPVEELYDLETDPYELENLADTASHRQTLTRLRGELDRWMSEVGDLGLVPEHELADWLESGSKSPPEGTQIGYQKMEGWVGGSEVFGKGINAWIDQLNGEDPLTRYRAIKSIGLIGLEAVPVLLASLSDWDDAVAFWGARSLGDLGMRAPEITRALEESLDREAWGLRLGAAYALVKLGEGLSAEPTLLDAMIDSNPFVRLRAMETLEKLEPKSDKVRAALELALQDSDKYIVRMAEHSLAAR